MLAYDDTEYPLVRMTISGVRTPDDNLTWMRRIERLLDLGERFVVVLHDQSTDCRPARARPWRGLRWALRHGDRFRRTCVAVAIVTSEASLDRVERTTRRLAYLTPVPTSLFCDVAMADAWVHSRLMSEDGRRVPGRHHLAALTLSRVLGLLRVPRLPRVRPTRGIAEPV